MEAPFSVPKVPNNEPIEYKTAHRLADARELPDSGATPPYRRPPIVSSNPCLFVVCLLVCLLAWLLGWLVGWWFGWLVGSLVGCMVDCL